MDVRLVQRTDVQPLYENTRTYVMPTGSIQRLPDGDLIMTFREAPRRERSSHTDPHSKAVVLRSSDDGDTWPVQYKQIIFDHPDPNCGVQDPAITVLDDGTLIASYFLWQFGNESDLPSPPPPGRYTRSGGSFASHAWVNGIWTVRSFDGGRTWESDPTFVETPLGLAATTSDPILQLPNGELLLPGHGILPDQSDVAFVMRSRDRGQTWTDFTITASDPKSNSEEPILYMEPSLTWIERTETILCMFRTRGGSYPNDLYQCHSNDLGRQWSRPKRIGIWGSPPQLLTLESGHVLCVYGYRREPFGVRACISVDGGQTWDVENELVLYKDGPSWDLGYPAAIQRRDGSILVAWYMDDGSPTGKGRILGTIIEEVS